MPLRRRGRQVLKGLAWSGRGAVRRVDVSLDGGRNWATARLEPPVLDKCLTRFYLEWEWNGERVYLQSRAMDESGYVQPDPEALVAARGLNSVYHNNAIQTWLVHPSGEVENVRLG
jgi:sulfane dehydrogenase subunit SoxC